MLTLLHVLEDSDRSTAVDALAWEIRRAEAKRYLRDVVGRVPADLSPEFRVEEGSTPARVAATAAEAGAGLVVLATRRDPALGYRIGGTAHKILETTACPVLAVPVAEDDSVERPPRRILVPLDGSLRSLHVLPTVQRLARAMDAHVVLATVVDSPVRTELLSRDEDYTLANELSDRLSLQAETYLTRIRSRLEANGVPVSTRVRRVPDSRSGLVDLAHTEDADLTIMSAHGSGCDPRRRYGTVPSHFIAHAGCSLLMLQDLPQHSGRIPRSVSARLPTRSLDAVAGGA
jgi:nucleotide-binding universal stress UspA family protein